MACSMSRPVEADREADIEVDEDEQICSPYYDTDAGQGAKDWMAASMHTPMPMSCMRPKRSS